MLRAAWSSWYADSRSLRLAAPLALVDAWRIQAGDRFPA
jgi:hypothetical protein